MRCYRVTLRLVRWPIKDLIKETTVCLHRRLSCYGHAIMTVQKYHLLFQTLRDGILRRMYIVSIFIVTERNN